MRLFGDKAFEQLVKVKLGHKGEVTDVLIKKIKIKGGTRDARAQRKDRERGQRGGGHLHNTGRGLGRNQPCQRLISDF